MSEQKPPRPETPEGRSSYTESGKAMEALPKFEAKDQAWSTLGKQGSCEVTIAARRKGSNGKYEYQIKDNNGVLLKKGDWVAQEKLSEM